MSDTKSQITGDCKERVAFDQMTLIESVEEKEESRKDPRKYYLQLYRECLQAISGGRGSGPMVA